MGILRRVDEFATSITPVLTVGDARRAIAFYAAAFGAAEVSRTTSPAGNVVAELAIGEARFRVADEAPDAGNLSPDGLRQGRIADPFGHHWLIGRPLSGSGDWAR